MRYMKETEFLETWTDYIPFKIEANSNAKRFAASFEVPNEYAPEETRPQLNGQPVKFTVTITGEQARRDHPLTGAVDDIFRVNNGQQITFTYKTGAGVIYSNNLSGMRQANFQGNLSFLVYSTVIKIVKVYVDRYKPDVIRFSAAHEGLNKIYHVLCLQAEKTFGYHYGNPKLGRENHGFIVISPDIYAKFKNYFASKNIMPQGASV